MLSYFSFRCSRLKTRREASRGVLILMEQGTISRGGFSSPYADENGRQKGFVEYSASHAMKVWQTSSDRRESVGCLVVALHLSLIHI